MLPNDNYLYGIVTTATKWYYLKFSTENEQHIFLAQKNIQNLDLYSTTIEDDINLKNQLKDVLGSIVWLLGDKMMENKTNKKIKHN